MGKTAIFPGSFDPVTNGHIDIINRALPLFDKIVIAIGINSKKQYFFPLHQRISWIEQIFEENMQVEVTSYQGLTIDFCKNIGANYIIRGLRSAADFEYERQIAQLNQSMNDEVETIFFASRPENSHISSTIVREIIMNGGDASAFVPSFIAEIAK